MGRVDVSVLDVGCVGVLCRAGWLADVEGFAYKEIAEIMGTPMGTVMSRLNRARKQLRKQLVDVAGARGIGPRAGQVDEEDLGRSAMARRAGREG